MKTRRKPRRASRSIVVVGGGPAGAVAAAALAREGRPVELLERDHFPRFHIGESLLPASIPVFDRLGLTAKLDAEGFPDKRGASFVLEDGSARFRVRFADALGTGGRAWHVLRARFDEILLRHAAESGARVVEGARVGAVELDPDGVRVRWVDSAGEERVSRADEIIDASGRRGLLARQLDLRRPHPGLRNVAVYAHVERDVPIPDAVPGDIVIISRHDLGWLWVIPLPGGRTSVGAVFRREDHPAQAEPATVLGERVRSTPLLRDVLGDWDPGDGARFESDFSYDAVSYAGDRWLLAGDAGAFLDPVFSTGVHFAVESGWQAAQAVLAGGHAARRRFERATRRRVREFRRFVEGFYRRSFRDVLFAPHAAPSIARVITGLLAGEPVTGTVARVKIGGFHAVTRIQSLLPLVPRVHREVENAR